MKTMLLKAEAILRYFLGEERMETIVMCPEPDVELIAYDQSLYEAIGALLPEERSNIQKLTKFLESVHIQSYRDKVHSPRKILTEERVKELRGMVQEHGTKH